MEAKKQRNAIILTVVITLAVVSILLTMGRVMRDRSKGYQASSWVLRSYGGGVALYQGDEITEIYGNIVLDNLPKEDIDLLEKGIAFPTREEAERAVEDYDG